MAALLDLLAEQGRFPIALSAPQNFSKIYISSVWGWPPAGLLPGCPIRCEVTTDEAEWRSADVVVWNPLWMTGNLQRMRASPSTKPAKQRWVFTYDFEAPISEPRDFMQVLGSGIDWTAGFQSGNDWFKPRIQLLPRFSAPLQTEAEDNVAGGKDKLLLWYVSNCGQARMQLFQSLASHLPADKVTMFGNCKGGQKDACRSRFNVSCTQEVMRRFKFYAAFENNLCDGYISEKFERCYEYGMVPIAHGGLSRADYERLVPGSSFIHVDDFKDHKALADYLIKLDGDDVSYNRYFDWRKHFEVFNWTRNSEMVTCQLCMEVRKPLHEQKPYRPNWNNAFFGKCRKAYR